MAVAESTVSRNRNLRPEVGKGKDRNVMVEGTVAWLAAKLEDNPDNPDGWIMLVRPYTVMGNADKAETVFDAGIDHFDGNKDGLARSRTEAGSGLESN